MTKSSFANAERLRSLLDHSPALRDHPLSWPLIRLVTGGSNLSSSGHPYIVEESFRLFVDHVPHLFGDGAEVLAWNRSLGRVLAEMDDLTEVEEASLGRTRKVLETMVFTANITAPSDLWLLRHVLGTHRRLGVLDRLTETGLLCLPSHCEALGLDPRQLGFDLHFLTSRGLCRHGDDGFHIGENAAARATLCAATELPPGLTGGITQKTRDWCRAEGGATEHTGLLREFFSLPETARAVRTGTWVPDWDQIEIGFRIVPLVLALRAVDKTRALKTGVAIAEVAGFLLPEMVALSERAGLLEEGIVTELGARVFARGPGPFGIIAAYDPYLDSLEDLLRGKARASWVARGENVAASQDANRKTFTAANDALDRFCEETGFRYTVFIEHAVGKGEATRQRYARSGDLAIRYFGADLEDAAIDAAESELRRGELPANMKFIRQADIGDPARVIEYLEGEGLSGEQAVMMVGNGFHEVRDQTNEKMLSTFRAYREAGILLIFTEETGLSDDDLIRTAWNTYHAGFRYVHEMSGQGLRPAKTVDSGEGRWSWARCAAEAGYSVQNRFSHRTRTIYPFSKRRKGNPSISVTYFCVPGPLARELALVAASEDELVSS